MKIRFRKIVPEAITPKYAYNGDAGLDFVAIEKDSYEDYVEYKTGIAIEIPPGYVGLIFPRSSISNYELLLTNSVGVIDSNYRGEVIFKFKRFGESIYSIGERIGQLIIIPYPNIELEQVEELSDSERGIGGFGSSGK